MASPFPERIIPLPVLRAMALGLALFFESQIAVTAGPYDRDLAIYDRALAETKPDEKWIRFGDVGVTPERLRDLRRRLVDQDFVTPGGTAFKWPAGNVYYRFNPAQVGNGTITAGKMQQFRDSIAEWAGWANVTFTESIAGQANYITVREDSSLGGGFSSAVGMGGGEQFLDFGPNAWNRGTICHEMGHALGLWHEMQRTDRDTYVVINFSNISSGNQPNFAVIPGSTNHGTYDFLSVMHYERNTLAINPNLDTVSMQPAYAQFADLIGRVTYRTLSKLDRKGMAEVYGNPAPLPGAAVTNTKEGGRGSLRNAIYYAFDRSTEMPPLATTVSFNIPTSDAGFVGGVFTIKLTSLLVAPGAGTTIDGATQTTFTGDTNASGPEVMLDGSQVAAQGLGLLAEGLQLREANCVVKSLTISGFNQQGITLRGTSASGNVVSGCYIGTNSAGTAAAPNALAGIGIFAGAHGNTIGGTTSATRNVISGNTLSGVHLYDAATDNTVSGNYIGANAAGTSAVPNGFAGVEIKTGAHANTIGAVNAGGRNLISGNKGYGVIVADAGSNANVIFGNYIGTDLNGAAPIGNGFFDPPTHFYLPGVGIYNGAQATVIGGSATNLVSGNAGGGIVIADAGTSGTLVRGNFIGTNASGSAAVANGNPEAGFTFGGVTLFGGAHDNFVGGPLPGAGNLISANGGAGVAFFDPATSGNFVQGNLIGLNAAGLAALGNGSSGIAIFSAANNTIGGTSGGARNFISGNSAYGIALGGANGNAIQGNTIGLNRAGSAVPNAFQGVGVFSGAQSNAIGGSAPGASNVIAGNTFEGVAMFDAATAKNSLSRNSIYGNGARGIALFSASNNSQPFPSLSSAVLSTVANPSGTEIMGTLTSAPSTTFTLEFFASATGDPSGFGEGQFFVGNASVTTNGSGNASFTTQLASAIPDGYVVSATATDPLGNSSEFSATRVVASMDDGSDGTPDPWMLTHFGHTDPRANDLSRANDDADGDGLTNLEEFMAGTDPRSALSGLRVIAFTKNGSDLSLTFTSVIGKTYRLEAKDNFTLTTWTLVQDQVAATTATTNVNALGATSAPQRAYRILVEP